METWDLRSLDVQPHKPQVLDTESEGRTIVLHLPAGEQLQEHQVHERAWIVVIDGEIDITSPDGESVSGGTGLLATFDPAERREVTARSDARLLILLGPWPGEGHPSQRP